MECETGWPTYIHRAGRLLLQSQLTASHCSRATVFSYFSSIDHRSSSIWGRSQKARRVLDLPSSCVPHSHLQTTALCIWNASHISTTTPLHPAALSSAVAKNPKTVQPLSADAAEAAAPSVTLKHRCAPLLVVSDVEDLLSVNLKREIYLNHCDANLDIVSSHSLCRGRAR